ncbi:MAG TPA: 3'-5' exonuclease [Ignavibacteria bacterium]|nr:3'-5' exonuclease [Ignavibacteria bacterium]
MKLTQEQIDIINSSGDITINAVAGSWKTTTLIEYAKARDINCRILYIAFNKSVRVKAIRRFHEEGLTNVRVETAHSLAYRHVVAGSNYKINPSGYKSYEVASMLGLRIRGEKHGELIAANHILKFVSYFCNSDIEKVSLLNYRDIISEPEALKFVSKYYEYIEVQTRILLSKMNSTGIEILHDFYLKKFQLSKPELKFDCILFDEGQDASAAMLDIFLKQTATKVIAGDTHQQIYGWRFAVNSMEKVNFRKYNLTKSFRFNQDIANMAMRILKMKNLLKEFTPLSIIGESSAKKGKLKAILGRTNLGLLVKAIEIVTERKNLKSLYFEGNFNSYAYADEGASLYDVLNLYNKKNQLIRDKLIREMKDMKELNDFIEKTGDMQLSMITDIVRKYGNSIPGIIREIKNKHVGNDEKEKAEIIFSSVHRCKGMEYDVVEIIDDFISEKEINKQIEENGKINMNVSKLNEEINLLYVAVTRTKGTLEIPVRLKFEEINSPDILTLKNNQSRSHNYQINDNKNKSQWISTSRDFKSYTVEEARKNNPSAYSKWTKESEDELKKMYKKGADLTKLAKHFNRTNGAIIARVEKLGLRRFEKIINQKCKIQNLIN